MRQTYAEQNAEQRWDQHYAEQKILKKGEIL